MARINAFATPPYPVIFSTVDSVEGEGIPDGHAGIAIALLVRGIPTFLATHVVPQNRLERILHSLRQGDVRVAVVGLPIDTQAADDRDTETDDEHLSRPAAFVSIVCSDGRRLTVARIMGPEPDQPPEDLARHIVSEIARGVQISELARA